MGELTLPSHVGNQSSEYYHFFPPMLQNYALELQPCWGRGCKQNKLTNPVDFIMFIFKLAHELHVYKSHSDCYIAKRIIG